MRDHAHHDASTNTPVRCSMHGGIGEVSPPFSMLVPVQCIMHGEARRSACRGCNGRETNQWPCQLPHSPVPHKLLRPSTLLWRREFYAGYSPHLPTCSYPLQKVARVCMPAAWEHIRSSYVPMRMPHAFLFILPLPRVGREGGLHSENLPYHSCG